MKKITSLLLACALGGALLAGCSDSNCNSNFGGAAPVPVPTPTPTPTRALNYNGFYSLNRQLNTGSNIHVGNPMVKGDADELFLTNYIENEERAYVYSKIMLDAVFGSILDIPTFIPGADYDFSIPFLEFNDIELIAGENAFYTHSPLSIGPKAVKKAKYAGDSVSYNYYENGVLYSQVIDEDLYGDFSCMYFSPSDNLLYLYNEAERELSIYRKSGSYASASHTPVKTFYLFDIPELAELMTDDTDVELLSIIAAADGSIYFSYVYYNYDEAPWWYNFMVARLAVSGETYAFDTQWTVLSLDNIPEERDDLYWGTFLRLAWGPEGKIVCAAPFLDAVKLLDPANGNITSLPAPATGNTQPIYYLSPAYNATTGNLYVLGLYGELTTEGPKMIDYLQYPSTANVYVYKFK